VAALLPVSMQGRGEERIAGMEVGELCTLDNCCLEAYVPHAQLVLHHHSIGKDLSLAACCWLPRESEKEGWGNVKEKANMEARSTKDPRENMRERRLRRPH